MAYTINFADPLSNSFSIPDGGYNGPGGNSSSTSLRLYGKGALEWGESVNENLVKLLETFCSATAPANPVNGQLWVENRKYYRSISTGTFYRFNYTANTWGAINVIQSSSAPTAVRGQYWFDTTSSKLYIYHQLFMQQPLAWNNCIFTTGSAAPDPAMRPVQQLRTYDASVGDWTAVPVVEISSSTATPVNSRAGHLRFNTSTGTLMLWTGFAWVTVSGSGGGGGAEYILPTATNMLLGGIRIGSGLIVSSEGIVSVEGYTLPMASNVSLGGIKIGSGLDIGPDGTVSATGGGSSPYVLPEASSSVLGGVKVGSGIDVTADGTISVTSTATPYTLPTATSTVLGGVKVGTGLSIDGTGTLNAAVSSNVTASNIGTGSGLYAGKVVDDLQFKTVIAGSNVVVTESATSITIDAVTGGTTSFGGESVGTGTSLYAGQNGVLLQLKSLTAGSNITLSDGGDHVTINATQPNIQASNVGSGTGLYIGKTGDLLSFKTIVGGSNVTISEANNTLYISASGGTGGGSSTGANLGSGNGIFANTSGSSLNFRSLVAGRNITLTSSTNTITIDGPQTVKSILDFGAVGDGVTNNIAAFTAAIAWMGANSRSVYIPQGTYLTTPMTIPAGVHFIGGFFGDDPKNTIIRHYGTSTAASAVLTIASSSMTTYLGGQRFANICFQANGSAAGSSAVRCYDLAWATFDHCLFQGGDVAFDCKGGVNIAFNQCGFQYSNIGLKITKFDRPAGGWPNAIKINDGVVGANAVRGIHFDHGRQLIITGTQIEGNGTNPGDAAHGGLYVGPDIGAETGTNSTNTHAGVCVSNVWFEENKGIADVYLMSGYNTITDCMFWTQPTLATNNVRILAGKYSLTGCDFAQTWFTQAIPNVMEMSGVQQGNVISGGEIPFITWNPQKTTILSGVKMYASEVHAHSTSTRGGFPVATAQGTYSTITKPHTATGYSASGNNAPVTIFFPYPYTDLPMVVVTPGDAGNGVAPTPMINAITSTYFTVIKRAWTTSGAGDVNYNFMWMATGNIA